MSAALIFLALAGFAWLLGELLARPAIRITKTPAPTERTAREAAWSRAVEDHRDRFIHRQIRRVK